MASAGSSAQTEANVMRMPKALSCDQPEWDKEARRYELEGKTMVGFDLDDEGRPVNPHTIRSSGWKLLDRMSERAVTTCRYAPPSDPAAMRKGLAIAFTWKLAPRPGNAPPSALVADSCPVSDRYTDFRPFSGAVPDGEGLLVRFLLTSTGSPFGVHIEGNSSPDTYQSAVAYLNACRFTPAGTRLVPGNLTGRLIPREG
jgi:protein TonB